MKYFMKKKGAGHFSVFYFGSLFRQFGIEEWFRHIKVLPITVQAQANTKLALSLGFRQLARSAGAYGHMAKAHGQNPESCIIFRVEFRFTFDLNRIAFELHLALF